MRFFLSYYFKFARNVTMTLVSIIMSITVYANQVKL